MLSLISRDLDTTPDREGSRATARPLVEAPQSAPPSRDIGLHISHDQESSQGGAARPWPGPPEPSHSPATRRSFDHWPRAWWGNDYRESRDARWDRKEPQRSA